MGGEIYPKMKFKPPSPRLTITHWRVTTEKRTTAIYQIMSAKRLLYMHKNKLQNNNRVNETITTKKPLRTAVTVDFSCLRIVYKLGESSIKVVVP